MAQVVLPRAKGIRYSPEVELKFCAVHDAVLALTPVITDAREFRTEEVDAEFGRMATNLKQGLDLLFAGLEGDVSTPPDPPTTLLSTREPLGTK